MARSALCVLCIAAAVFSIRAAHGEETPPPLGFAEIVITRSLAAMPEDLRGKLSAGSKQILSAAVKPKSGGSSDAYYFVATKEGTAVEAFAEAFRQARKAVAEGKSVAAAASALGKVACCAIVLAQPYHTEESAFKSAAHVEFERRLDSIAATGESRTVIYRKVDNPSELAESIAARANEELKKLQADVVSEADKAAAPDVVLGIAMDGVVSAWRTLQEQKDSSVAGASASSGRFIGNKRSLKFHSPTCRFLPAEKNRVLFDTREAAMAEGYVPCKVCKP